MIKRINTQLNPCNTAFYVKILSSNSKVFLNFTLQIMLIVSICEN
jgi:hypothetical protein